MSASTRAARRRIIKKVKKGLIGLALAQAAMMLEAQAKITPPFFHYVPQFEQALKDKAIKYLILKGGRGGGKSIGGVCHLIEESFDTSYRNSRFLCGREIQGSIEDSVYSMVKGLIERAYLTEYFSITQTRIVNRITGVEFIFSGFRATSGDTSFSQLNKIKGKFDVKYVLVDEAQDLTEDTLNVLLPTANRGSDIAIVSKPWHPKKLAEKENETRFIFLMNPNFDNDPVVLKVKTFIEDAEKNKITPYALILHINIFDIPEQFQDKQLLKQAHAEKGEIYYDHVWLGEPFHKLSGRPWEKCADIATDETFDCIAFLDPSFAGGDFTALSFLGMDRAGRLISWGKVWAISWDAAINYIVDELREYMPQHFYYEANALHRAPQKFFAEHGVNAEPHLSLTNKIERIYRVASIISNRMHIAESRCNREYVRNVREYNDQAPHDDAPDSLASACIKAGILPEKMSL